MCLCVQFFAKCGILKEDDDGKPRVKLYKDRASGMLKGDGLVYYLKQPSVGHQTIGLIVHNCTIHLASAELPRMVLYRHVPTVCAHPLLTHASYAC